MSIHHQQSLQRLWIAVNTYPNKEVCSVTNLERQGFEVYCPKLAKRVSHARKIRDVLRPMFPGYVFICLDPKREAWRSILYTTGVRLLVRFGGDFGTLPDGFVEALKAREQDGAVRPGCDRQYVPGDKIRLTHGALDSLVATVLRVNEKQRLSVLMDLFSRKVRVNVPCEDALPLATSC